MVIMEVCKDKYSAETEERKGRVHRHHEIETEKEGYVERGQGWEDSLAMYFRRNPLAVVTEGRFDTTDNPNSEMHSGRSFAQLYKKAPDVGRHINVPYGV